MKIFTNKQWKEFIHHQKECTRNAIIKAGVENQESKGISFKTVYICDRVLPKQIIFTKLKKAPKDQSELDQPNK